MNNPYADEWIEKYGRYFPNVNFKSCEDGFQRSELVVEEIENVEVLYFQNEILSYFQDAMDEVDPVGFVRYKLEERLKDIINLLCKENKEFEILSDKVLTFHEKLEERIKKEKEQISRKLEKQRQKTRIESVSLGEMKMVEKKIKIQLLKQMLAEEGVNVK